MKYNLAWYCSDNEPVDLKEWKNIFLNEEERIVDFTEY
jgi:hypothetical protein